MTGRLTQNGKTMCPGPRPPNPAGVFLRAAWPGRTRLRTLPVYFLLERRMEHHVVLGRLRERLAGGAAEPVAHLIVETLWLAVVDGTLSSGERLPTARQISVALNVSPRTVERAYRQLEHRGVIATRRGEGTFVSLAAPSEEERARHEAFATLCRETVERTRSLGFDLDELMDALLDYRATERESPKEER